MDEAQILALIRKELDARAQSSQYKVSKVPFHTHNNLDSPPISFHSLTNAPHTFTIAATTDGTTNVNVFTSGGAPYALTIIGVFLISLDTTAANITVLQRGNTVCTIAKGTTAGALVGATSLSNTLYNVGDVFQVDSSSSGNAKVFITYKLN